MPARTTQSWSRDPLRHIRRLATFAGTLGPYARPAAMLALLLVVIKTAWVGDDAFITLRTVDNLLHGHGLVWNLGERVQPFTHPLWLAWLTVFHAVIREPFLTFQVAGTVTTLAAFAVLLWRLTPSATNALLAGGVLVISKYFVDFATGGLGNPLLYLLVAWYVVLWFRLRDKLDAGLPAGRPVFMLVLAFALVVLTRLDVVLLVGPPLLVLLYRAGRCHWRAMALGIAPLVAWEIFAVVYFGFPVPNTAYAKLNTGIPLAELVRQGFYYYQNFLGTDPLAALVLAITLVMVFLRPGRGERAFGVGLVLYMLYIVRIGGDFMAGRFFTVPLFLAVCLLARRPTPRPRVVGVAALVLVAALFVPRNPVTCAFEYTLLRDFHGIVDERGYYYRFTGALPRLAADHEEIGTATAGQDSRLITDQRGPAFHVVESVGIYCYFAGPDLYGVDRFALADAFLARLPANRTAYHGSWRIGHFYRDLPEGYNETVGSGKNMLQDKRLARLYDDVQLVTTGPLFSKARWAAIWRLNTRQWGKR